MNFFRDVNIVAEDNLLNDPTKCERSWIKNQLLPFFYYDSGSKFYLKNNFLFYQIF